MPQNPVCLFWSSPRWYICLRVMAILKHRMWVSFFLTDWKKIEMFLLAHLFFLLTIMSIVWSSRLSKARISLSVTFLWGTTDQDVRVMQTGMWYRIIMSGAKESNSLCFTVAEGKPTGELTWGNRTCKCRDSWPHQSLTAEPWVWLQLHRHDWLAAQWTGCLNRRKQTTEKSHHGLSFSPTPRENLRFC